jgi:hypothetical protein
MSNRKSEKEQSPEAPFDYIFLTNTLKDFSRITNLEGVTNKTKFYIVSHELYTPKRYKELYFILKLN